MIVIFCGIPASGKTTIAEMLAQRLAALGSIQVLSSDKIKAPVYRKLFKALEPNQRREDFLILDATFYKKEWRQRIKNLAQDEKVVTVYLYCPLEVAHKRNKERQRHISEKALHIVFHRMEPPEHPSISIDTATTAAADAAAKIFELIRNQP